MTRWAVFVHDPDGDMGYGRMVGPFYDADAADAKAEAIRRVSDDYVECIVVPLMPSRTPARSVAKAVR